MAKRKDNDSPFERLLDADSASESTMMQNMSGSVEYAHDVEVGNPSTEISAAGTTDHGDAPKIERREDKVSESD